MSLADVISSVHPERFLIYLDLDDVVSYRNAGVSGGVGVTIESYLPDKFADMVLNMVQGAYARPAMRECSYLEYRTWLPYTARGDLDTVIERSTARIQLCKLSTFFFGLSPQACFNMFHQLVSMNDGKFPFRPEHLLWACFKLKINSKWDSGTSARFVQANNGDEFQNVTQNVIREVLTFFEDRPGSIHLRTILDSSHLNWL